MLSKKIVLLNQKLFFAIIYFQLSKLYIKLVLVRNNKKVKISLKYVY